MARPAAVVTTTSGKVIRAGWDDRYGKIIEIENDQEFVIMYGHNSRLLVREGEMVSKGDVIAFVGSTGLSSAPHLHYEIRLKGKPVDPKYLAIARCHHPLDWSYILSDTLKFTWSILRMLNTVESKVGESDEMGFSLGGYASLCMAVPLFGRALKYHEKAINMRKEFKERWGDKRC